MSAVKTDEILNAILDAKFDGAEMLDFLAIVTGMSKGIITLKQFNAMSSQLDAGVISRADGLRNLASSIGFNH